MKTKQSYMRAVFTTRADNARNWNGEKELITRYRLIDKKTERVIVDARVYMGRSRTASAVYASVWVHGIKNKPDAWEDGETSGRGLAGGWGYHKTSAAIASAIEDAGIELYGSRYGHPINGDDSPQETKKLLKTRAYIHGGGDGSVECALMAIAYAAGYTDCILVK